MARRKKKKKVRGGRMPKPTEFKMGTKKFKSKKLYDRARDKGLPDNE